MNSQQLIQNIRNYCIANANEANVIKYSRYFKDKLDAYGLSQIQMEWKLKNILNTPGISLELVLEAAPVLIQSGKYEETGFILLLTEKLHKQFSKEVFNRIEEWYTIGINNWAHADMLGTHILPLFLSKRILLVTDFRNWLEANNKFQRRSVPVTFIKSLKTHKNYPELFAYIECLMTDPEREVHQGTGWFLREAWKRKSEETEAFLFKWKDISPRLIFQYATEKMTPEQKLRFKKEQRFNI